MKMGDKELVHVVSYVKNIDVDCPFFVTMELW